MTLRDWIPRGFTYVPVILLREDPWFKMGCHQMALNRERRCFVRFGSSLFEWFIGPRGNVPGIFTQEK